MSSLVPSLIVGSTVQKIPPGKHLVPKSKNATGVVDAMSSSFGGAPRKIQITCYTECKLTLCVCVVGGDDREGRDGRAGRVGYFRSTGDSCSDPSPPVVLFVVH